MVPTYATVLSLTCYEAMVSRYVTEAVGGRTHRKRKR